ncbi:DNA (cytosine-5-)-methyltransferase [Agriterribacter sp.]|uniref:DNA cytosine methyltransferase n=1 Tax=Agriterribacter sp. TaxID=2821509 RepID=UPI002C51E7DD|nr:DNA (cytosine-5-)-methyltransferase [Agriterribacter sp.]HTN09135.1 DNA (cytosine-5-)-methyltransferase [Agriterribacter sp.]
MYKSYNENSEFSVVEEPQILIDFKTTKSNATASAKKTYKVVSLFSGCGGLDLGFTGGFNFRDRHFGKNKFKIEFANDIDPAAELVYNSNKSFFGKHSLVKDDIKNIDINNIPDFDFLLAGFPCQPFSNAGLRKGINDERGNLFEECENLLKQALKRKNPPIGFVFENVKGILSSKMDNGTSIPDEIVKRTEKLGFKTNYKLFKTCDYGVPSNRQRLIIVGIRKDIGYFDYSLLDQVVAAYNLPNEKENPYDLYLGSALCDIPKNAPQYKDYWKYSPGGQYMVDKIGACLDGKEALQKFKKRIPLHKISNTITTGRSWKNMNPKDMSERFLKIWDNPQKYRAPNFYRRFALGEINGTITASAQPENCGITHPFENRRFTIREAARIQSFPDDFTFPYKTMANAYKVIGNAVPPIFGWVIAKALTRHIDNG